MFVKRVVPILIVLSLLLSACAQATPTPTEVPPTEPPPPTSVPATEAPAAEPTEAPVVETADCPDGLAGENIVFYSQAGLTGPLSQILGDSFINGTRDAIEEINGNGGICGATVEFRIQDTQYDATQEIAIYDQYREEDPPPMFVLTYASPATIALKDKVIEDHIVNIAAGLVAEAFYQPRDGWTVGVAPIYSDQFAGFSQWVSDNWDDVKPEGAGDDIVIGVIGWQGSFGAGATTVESLAYAESLGITVLPLETIAVDPTADPSEQVQSLVSQGANVIYNQSLSFTPARVIGAIRALGLWDSLVVGGVNWTMNQDVLNILGENAALAEGYYGVFPYLWWNDTDNEAVQAANALFAEKGYPDSDKAVGYLLSYGSILAIADVVQHAIETDGYANLSGDTFFNAFKDLGTVSAGGLYEFNVVGEDRAPREAQIRQAQVVDGKVDFFVVQDFFELPDTRPPAP